MAINALIRAARENRFRAQSAGADELLEEFNEVVGYEIPFYNSRDVTISTMLMASAMGAVERNTGGRLEVGSVRDCIAFMGGPGEVIRALRNIKDTQYVMTILYEAFERRDINTSVMAMHLVCMNESGNPRGSVHMNLMPAIDKMMEQGGDLEMVARHLFVNVTVFVPIRGVARAMLESDGLTRCLELTREYHPIAFLLDDAGQRIARVV
jgi:hypothetical protein